MDTEHKKTDPKPEITNDSALSEKIANQRRRVEEAGDPLELAETIVELKGLSNEDGRHFSPFELLGMMAGFVWGDLGDSGMTRTAGFRSKVVKLRNNLAMMSYQDQEHIKNEVKRILEINS